jgi:hypothetical protein
MTQNYAITRFKALPKKSALGRHACGQLSALFLSFFEIKQLKIKIL